MPDYLTLRDLYDGLREDPFYGNDDRINQLVERLKEELIPPQASLSIFTEVEHEGPQIELIHLLWGFGGLEALRTNGGARDAYYWEYERGHFGQHAGSLLFGLGELKRCLRRLKLPLPVAWFLGAQDNTQHWVEIEEEGLSEHWDKVVRLGEIEDAIKEWEGKTAETVSEQHTKERRLNELGRGRERIEQFLAGEASPPEEAP